ncbi:serine/threonine-protein kinase [Streptomyces jeddahensis]|nr:serine/threonine-protein kinase [Streptomyces jeddahensis]
MGTEGDNVRVIAGRYRLQARLGRGGMGVVWRATDQLLGRQVAVKELALDETLSPEEARLQRERTLREARAVAQLSHPNVVVVHDVVEDDERPYLVMELIDGGSLAERIAREGPVGAAEAARIGLALLAALQKAHQAGVLHRDLKPANVLMEAGTGRVVLTDFGIAQVSGATTLTETGSFVGSPEYTSPERMSGDRTGPESDLWSLGALLCTVLSGESPFHRDSLGGVLHAVVMDEIRLPEAAAPLQPVVVGLLERDPDRRLTAAEAERMLRAYIDTGRTPQLPTDHVPTQRDMPRHHMPRPHVPLAHVSLPHVSRPHVSRAEVPRPASPRGSEPRAPKPRRSTRTVLVAAALVLAAVGAGVSVTVLLMGPDGDVERAPGTSVPSPTASPERPTPTVTVTRQQTETTTATPAPAAPAGYRTAKDPKGFSLAVPEGFTRKPQGARVFYMSPGGTFRIGIKVSDPEKGGPLEVMRRSHAEGPENNPGYRDGEVTATTHDGRPAAFWEFTWDGFTEAEGARRTYDLCWEERGRMYDVWVSAPVGRSDQAKRYFDTAVDSFVPTAG